MRRHGIDRIDLEIFKIKILLRPNRVYLQIISDSTLSTVASVQSGIDSMKRIVEIPVVAVLLQLVVIMAVATGTFGIDTASDTARHLRGEVQVLRQLPSRQLDPTLDYGISIKNNCYKTIRVGIRYLPIGSGDWLSKGWWTLQPNEVKYIAKTKNRNVYFTAYSTDGKIEWGNLIKRQIKGQWRMFFKTAVPTSSLGEKYTQGFTCTKPTEDPDDREKELKRANKGITSSLNMESSGDKCDEVNCKRSCPDLADLKCEEKARKLNKCCPKKAQCSCEDKQFQFTSDPTPPNSGGRRPFNCSNCRCCKDKCADEHSTNSDKKNCKKTICREYFGRDPCDD